MSIAISQKPEGDAIASVLSFPADGVLDVRLRQQRYVREDAIVLQSTTTQYVRQRDELESSNLINQWADREKPGLDDRALACLACFGEIECHFCHGHRGATAALRRPRPLCRNVCSTFALQGDGRRHGGFGLTD